MSGPSDSEPGQRRDTHRGLGEVEAAFTPSDSSELRPSFDPAYPEGHPEHAVKLPASPKLPALDDLMTGTQEMTPERRALFDTSIGGGANRVSGGRETARAYVAPRTPRPVLFHSQDTMSIEVAERNNQFDTVPSLSRRKLARLLGEPDPGPDGRAPDRGVNLWFVMGLALFGGIFLVFLANRESDDPAQENLPKVAAQGQPLAPPKAKTAPAAKLGSEPASVVPQKVAEPAAVEAGVQAEPIEATRATEAPAASPRPAAKPAKAPASKSSKPTSKGSSKDDLWLE